MRRRLLADLIALLTIALLAASEATAYALSDSTGVWQVLIERVAAGSVPFVLSFGGVGWLLARRLPGNAIGWSFGLGWGCSGRPAPPAMPTSRSPCTGRRTSAH
jgi:hypothetical protein